MLRHCMWHLIAQPLGRDWVCVCRGAGGRGDGGGAGWRALRGGGGNFDECGVTRTFRNDAHLTTLLTGRGLSGMVRVSDVPHCICGRFTPSWTRIRKVNVRDVSGMLVERVFLVSGVVKTVFSHNKKK